MYRWFLVVLVACTTTHDSMTMELTSSDCAACHLNDRNAPMRRAAHAQNGIDPDAATCSNCHHIVDTGAGAADWAPALLDRGSHPQDRFDIASGPHAKILCADCHDPTVNRDPSALPPPSDPNRDTPMNVLCVGCHTGDHALEAMDAIHAPVFDNYATFSYARGPEQFCRNCHSLGQHL